jgi:hypothetical protein
MVASQSPVAFSIGIWRARLEGSEERVRDRSMIHRHCGNVLGTVRGGDLVQAADRGLSRAALPFGQPIEKRR